MKNEDIIVEISSLLDFIDETRDEISVEHDKFQIALTNTLRLLDEGSSTLTKMKGNVGDLKAYLIRTSTEIRQTSLAPYETLRARVERIRNLIQTP
ncbi:MAG: hypothetical protein ACXAEF_09515 [Candidatus Thorarchaeota archaeon]|jgi:hypothetical protein